MNIVEKIGKNTDLPVLRIDGYFLHWGHRTMTYHRPLPNNPRAVAYLDMAQAGARIPDWLDASTPLRRIVRDYWRGEVAAGSPVLARLAAICAERGYSYESTVEALR